MIEKPSMAAREGRSPRQLKAQQETEETVEAPTGEIVIICSDT
jgi:hypothetical protein